VPDPFSRTSDYRRLADAGRAGNEQDVSLVIAVLGHRRFSMIVAVQSATRQQAHQLRQEADYGAEDAALGVGCAM
jgi:hypothetical protein